jgi:hypothetical protein
MSSTYITGVLVSTFQGSLIFYIKLEPGFVVKTTVTLDLSRRGKEQKRALACLATNVAAPPSSSPHTSIAKQPVPASFKEVVHAIVLVELFRMIFTKYAPSSPPPFHPLLHYVDMNLVSTCSFPHISCQLRLAATCSGPMGNHTCGSGRVSSDAIDRQLNGNFTGHSSLSSRQAPPFLSTSLQPRSSIFFHSSYTAIGVLAWEILALRCRGESLQGQASALPAHCNQPRHYSPYHVSS